MKVVFLTGAGISVASGLQPFRGKNGIYNDQDVAALSQATALETRLEDVWRFWGGMADLAWVARPNAAHLAIAGLEQRLPPDSSVTVITMNVDGLHQRAGSSTVLELHGSVLRSRCMDTGEVYDPVTQRKNTSVPRCTCGAPLRPDIVLFEEDLPLDVLKRAREAARYADLFIVVGTSNTVRPACRFVRKPFYKGAYTVFINPEIPPGLRYFRKRVSGLAEEKLPELLDQLVAGELVVATRA